MNITKKKSKNQMYSFILIPHVFKKIGYVGAIIFFILYHIFRYVLTEYSFLGLPFYSLMLFFMLIIAVSKEEVEDEMTIQIRAYSYSSAFLVAVIYAIIQPLLAIMVSYFKEVANFHYYSVGISHLLWFTLLQQIIVFNRLKRKQDLEE